MIAGHRLTRFGRHALLALTASLAASCATHVSPASAGVLADLRIVNRSTGQIAPTYQHQGRLYVAGNPGDRFAVQVVNRSQRRVLAVASVDGVNVVSGETANPSQSGYVLAPNQSYDILGWRKNTNEVAAFYFTTLGDSYAARTDRPANVGVVGLAVFREYQPPRPRPLPQIAPPASAPMSPQSSIGPQSSVESPRADSPRTEAKDSVAQESAGALGRAAPAPRERIGTGHGERIGSDVTLVDFRRASTQADEVITIHYDTHTNLVARGIIQGGPVYGEPQPFPGVRFAPDPRG